MSRLDRGILRFIIGLLLCGLVTTAAFADPVVPSGLAVLNQSLYGLPLTKSDTTVLVPTRGVYIGDAAPCNLSVEFAANPGTAVAVDSVQPGLTYPFSITKLKAATTCADVVGLW